MKVEIIFHSQSSEHNITLKRNNVNCQSNGAMKQYALDINDLNLNYIKNQFCFPDDDNNILTIKDDKSHENFLEYLKKENIKINTTRETISFGIKNFTLNNSANSIKR